MKNIKMKHIKMKNLLAENMRRFGTKNLKEASYRGDEINTGLDDYFFNNKPFRGYVHPEDMIGDLDIADINRDGKAYARVGQGFLDYLSDADTIRRAQKHEEYNDAIINTNSNMINAAIAKLKQNPSDKMAQSVIRDEISDFWSTID